MRSTMTMLALAGTFGLMICGDTLAQRGGGGNRGGGGSRPNTYPGYHSGYGNYGSYGGYRGGYNNGITFGVGIGYGIQHQYYNRSYYPYSSSYVYPSQGTTYYTTPSVVYSTPNVVYTPSSPIYDTTTVTATMPVEVTTGRAIIEVTVPAADAKVLFGSTVMEQQQGKERRYESTEITLGQNFTYTITARWMNDGKPMEQIQKVDVMAGRTSKAIFRNEEAVQQLPPPEPSRVK